MKIRRITESAWLTIVTGVLCLGFLALRNNQQEKFAEITANYNNQLTVDLTGNFDPQILANRLVSGNYMPDTTSAIFIAKHIKAKLAKGTQLPNLGELNKRVFRISGDSVDLKGGSYLKNRIESSRESLGMTRSLPNKDTISSETLFDAGNRNIAIKVETEITDTIVTMGWLNKTITRKKPIPAAGVLVEITEHYYDGRSEPQAVILGYAKTDTTGIAVFKGLKANGFYSVLPIQRGFEYGNPKGTVKGNLQKTLEKSFFDKIKNITGKKKIDFTFTQREHQIAPFDTYTYNCLKEDNAVTVRTPQEYQGKLMSNLIFILFAWWALHFYLVLRKKKTDQFILPGIMFLSGICLLIMYSIHNPLNDRMLGNDMATSILVGIVLIGLFSEINFITFFNNRYAVPFDFILAVWQRLSKSFKMIKRKTETKKLPEGSGYLILALFLTFLLFFFGSSPQAGVKVNLFFFQPSEIAKYLIVIFLAAFFYHNAKKIQTFSEDKKISSAGKIHPASFGIQFRTVRTVIISLGALLLMYLILGDMGPALVIAGTFIIIYSFVRKDLIELCIGLVSFLVFMKTASLLVPHSQLVLFAAALAWLFVWIIYGFKINRKKQFFESAVFLNLVIAAFIFGSNLPNVGERLQDRNEIYMNIWDNEVHGGDHVAQGLWGLASGGVVGQGLGEGNPNLVPESHTDMIFTSIGEETGWLGLLAITLCMAVLLYRCLIVGKRAGNPFAFYLAAGIAIITGVQFLIITFGCVGIIPLTGVAVPFLSYGKVSMIMNMAAFGIVFSVSGNRATENQEKQMKKYNLMIETCKYTYGAFAIVLLITLFYYQCWGRNEILVRPALTSNTQGAKIVEYNPRIRLLMRELYAGNIKDRNGILLATNDREEVRKELDKFNRAGVGDIAKNELKQRKRRYYPFGANMFFWLGDFNNTDVAWSDNDNDPHGYIAEHRHLADLRGFDNLKRDNGNIKKSVLTTEKYRESNFLDARPYTKSYTDYDYSFLTPYLKAGIHSRKVKQFNEERENRDITLTVDAVLQTKMQTEIADYVKNNFKGTAWNKLRISVVALDAKKGDVLCSANYPLPDMQTLKSKREEQVKTKKYGYSEKDRNEKAYTDRDLGLTYQTAPGSTAKVISALAGLQKLGTKAANKTYYIDAREAVETGIEPCNYNVTPEDAIVKSSNNYFINLVNDQKLYENLDSIYRTVGIRIDRHYTRNKKENNALTPYFFIQNIDEEQKRRYNNEVNAVKNKGTMRYENYREKRKKEPRYFEKMNWFETAWAWGQGSMSATPLNMARIASIVVNDGVFVETQFIEKGNKTLKVEKPQTTRIVSKDAANILKGYMIKEAMQEQKTRNKVSFSYNIGGKTGTPERELRYVKYNNKGEPIRNKEGKIIMFKQTLNDGWYIFFTNSENPLAVAVRMERLSSKGSGRAVLLTEKVVLKVLSDAGYLN